MRFCASHCLSLPFWYRASRRSRPSSYSQVNLAAPCAGTVQVSLGVGWMYMSRVLTARSFRKTAPERTFTRHNTFVNVNVSEWG